MNGGSPFEGKKRRTIIAVFVLQVTTLIMALSLFLIFSVEMAIVLGVSCDAPFVGYNTTTTTRNAATGQMYATYGSVYSNGTFVNYDADYQLGAYGPYIIEAAQDAPNTCYINIIWECCGDLTNVTEYATFSPTEDGNSAVGCYTFGDKRISQCTPDNIGDGWFGLFKLNKLTE